MAQAVQHVPSNNDVLRPIEGNYRWSGVIGINFLDSGNVAERERFSSSETFQGSSSNYAGLSGSWRAEFLSAVGAFSKVANISVDFNNDINANYLVGDINDANTIGFFDFPGQPVNGNTLVGGFSTSAAPMLVQPELGGGSLRYYNFLHEFGHALGLAHPFDDGLGTPVVGEVSNAPPPYTSVHTVMSYDVSQVDGVSYSSPYGYAVTPMALDIAALQAMYGATASSNSGVTKYQLLEPSAEALDTDGGDGSVSVGRAYYCIWDTGGVDEIAHSESEDPTGPADSSILINLNAATLSSETPEDVQAWISELQSTAAWNDLLSEKTRAEIVSSGYQSGGFFSSLLDGAGNRLAGGYTIANGAVIENATGGGGDDIIIGNNANNKLFGGLGGKDVLIGGGGNDIFEAGWEGGDVLIGGAGDDDYLIYAINHESVTWNLFQPLGTQYWTTDFDLSNFQRVATINDADGEGNIEMIFTTQAYFNNGSIDIDPFLFETSMILSGMTMVRIDETPAIGNTVYTGIDGPVWEFQTSVFDRMETDDGGRLDMVYFSIQATQHEGDLYLWTLSHLAYREPQDPDIEEDGYPTAEVDAFVEVAKIENFTNGDLGIFLT